MIVAAAARRPLTTSGLLHLLAGVTLFGISWPLTKLALDEGAPPMLFAFLRLALAALILGASLGARGRLRLPGRGAIPTLVAIGVFQLFGFYALAHEALVSVPAGRTAILANATTFWVAPLSLVILRERASRRRWLAAALGLAGVVVLCEPWSAGLGAGVLRGEALLLGAALSWSLAIVFLRRFPPRRVMDLLPWCFALAALCLAPFTFGERLADFRHLDLPGWVALATVGCAIGPFGTWCITEASIRLPALLSSVGFLGSPALGLTLSVLFLAEPVDRALAAGTVLILGAVALAAWPESYGPESFGPECLGPEGVRKEIAP